LRSCKWKIPPTTDTAEEPRPAWAMAPEYGEFGMACWPQGCHFHPAGGMDAEGASPLGSV
jgi:hypothetical protein